MKSKEFKIEKNHIVYLILIAILILGLYLRIYHLDFPSIGYHNMKENEYISEAIFFNEQGNYLHRRTFNFWGLEDGPGYFEEYAQMPIVPYLTAFSWKIIGSEPIWIPRMLILISMLGSIVTIYFVTKKLFDNEYVSLLSSFLLAVMPLGIYFGRNIQPESPALFFMLLAFNSYLNWTKNLDKRQLLYTALFAGITGLFKSTFLIAFLPMVFIFPFNEFFSLKTKEKLSQVKNGFLGLLPFIFLQILYTLTIIDPSKSTGSEFRIGDIFNFFSASFWARTWPSVSSYISDNFTWWFFWFAVVGFLLILLKHRKQFSRFLIGYGASVIVYGALLSSKIGGHSYYQMPFLPLVCILSAYFFFTLGSLAKQIFKNKYIIYVPLLIILLAMPEMQAANDRVWNTIFYGQDIVGEYIKSNTNVSERFLNMGHAQTQAVCTYARRRCGGFNNLTQLIEFENKFNIQYLNIDTYSMSKLASEQNDSLEYIMNNYKIELVGAIKQGNNLVPVNFLFKRGGKFNFSEINTKKPQLAEVYDIKGGKVEFYILK